MKIYRKVVLDMETGRVLEEDAYEYQGPLARCDGGPGAGASGIGESGGDASGQGIGEGMGSDSGAPGVSSGEDSTGTPPGAVQGDPESGADPALGNPANAPPGSDPDEGSPNMGGTGGALSGTSASQGLSLTDMAKGMAKGGMIGINFGGLPGAVVGAVIGGIANSGMGLGDIGGDGAGNPGADGGGAGGGPAGDAIMAVGGGETAIKKKSLMPETPALSPPVITPIDESTRPGKISDETQKFEELRRRARAKMGYWSTRKTFGPAGPLDIFTPSLFKV